MSYFKSYCQHFVYTPKHDKTLLIKKWHAWIMKESSWFSIRSFLLLLSRFHSAGSFHILYQRRKAITNLTWLWILWTITITNLQRYAHWYNSSMSISGMTNHFLIGFKGYRKSLVRFCPLKMTGNFHPRYFHHVTA